MGLANLRTSTASGTSVDGATASGGLTPAVGDYWIVYATETGPGPFSLPTVSDTGGGIYVLVERIDMVGGMHTVWARTSLIWSTTFLTISCAPNSPSCSSIWITTLAFSNLADAGLAPLRRREVTSGSGGTPASLTITDALSTSVVIASIGCLTSNTSVIFLPPGFTTVYQGGTINNPVGSRIAQAPGASPITAAWATNPPDAWSFTLIEFDGYTGANAFYVDDEELVEDANISGGLTQGYAPSSDEFGYAEGYDAGLEAGNIVTYRMRAYDAGLARYVYWNASAIALALAEYTGPGGLTDVVVFQLLGS